VTDLLRYDGKRTIVTGAASGMGAETARLVTALGGEVFALDIKEPTVEVAKFLPVDLGDPAAIDAAVDSIGGPIHALFNCAGLPNTFPGQQVMRVNFLGHRYLTEKVVPLMPAGGAVGFISSVGGMNFMAHMGELAELCGVTDFDAAREWCESHDELVNEGYSLSKEAIVFYTMQRSGSLLAEGKRINCISPGPTDTAMMPAFEAQAGKELIDAFVGPSGRRSNPEEQAWPLLFLNSPRSSYVAGEALHVDAGFLGAMVTGQL
jgi:NAD(P)-dependent dehydrogenase (short-subunit alcohol dehydrogenase family)